MCRQCVGRGEWIDASEAQYDSGNPLCGWVVTCRQWHPFDECYDGEFLTSFPVNGGERARLIAKWGRRRWNIENGFHAEKHGGFGLEYAFCNDSTASRNLHVVMEIAYALWQVFDMGMLKRLARGTRKVTQEGWAKLLFAAILISAGGWQKNFKRGGRRRRSRQRPALLESLAVGGGSPFMV